MVEQERAAKAEAALAGMKEQHTALHHSADQAKVASIEKEQKVTNECKSALLCNLTDTHKSHCVYSKTDKHLVL